MPLMPGAKDSCRSSASSSVPFLRMIFVNAACLLMPKAWVRRLYFDHGLTDLRRLAHRFDVSQTAMRVRLESLGMIRQIRRCGYGVAA